MSFDVRPCADLDEFLRATMAVGQYFGHEPNLERTERFARMLPFERMHAAWEDGEIVGGAGGFPFELSVPGALLRCAGTTVVGVAPTHRRRGVLRAMMRAHLDDAHARGEPVAALWASEETIYGRFGYGAAAYAGEVRVPREYVDYVAPRERNGRMRIVERDEALEKFPPLWEALARIRPGVFIRTRDWWELRALHDPPERRGGAGPKRYALLERDGEAVAYATYRHKMDWQEGVSSGEVSVVEGYCGRPGCARGRVALPARHRLDRDDRVGARPARPSTFLRARANEAHAVPARRRPLGAARRRRRGAVGTDVSRGR
jgi:predicted N-acetyltransferase YhbS